MGKLFVIIRKDLPLPHQAVQAGHAVAKWMLENNGHEWNNSTLVYVTVEDLDHLTIWGMKLDSRLVKFSAFVEPDQNYEMTAIACYTETNIFSNLKMWGH